MTIAVEAEGYTIWSELHVSRPTVDTWGNRHEARVFHYVIRRPDGTPLFRTETHAEARDIIARILEPGVLSR